MCISTIKPFTGHWLSLTLVWQCNWMDQKPPQFTVGSIEMTLSFLKNYSFKIIKAKLNSSAFFV